MNVAKGTWVGIESVVLTPEERAPGLPEDTAATPYVLRLSGFLAEEAEVGQQVSVTSLIGRTHRGVLREVNPSYDHSFGATVPELLQIGLREG
ncbi:MAG TPA: 2-amino-4-oxopentanoate thiolase subunit OrtA [Thermoanaerobaculia bacterium]|nr:2-amino-4-oxopentanoate thiolase subunit OrtA [Thermoanaerobaculia bacterium]